MIESAPALTLRLGSDALTRAHSHGEVRTHRTLNWRTRAPHPGGLMDPALFGPLHARTCACGTKHPLTALGARCPKCGMEITTRRARRHWSAHLELHAPIAHPLFLRELGQVLGLSTMQLHAVLTGQADAPWGGRGPQTLWDALVEIREGTRELGAAGRAVQRLLADQHRAVTDLMRWTLPVHPADLRPVLDTRTATLKSDLNDLYRRVITTRDRLHALRDSDAPPLLVLTAHVQLQEAVTDVTTFLLGNLAGKRGRFRRTMLGKRVDFSARAVITPGPDLPLDEVGLPEPVARELFTPHLRRALRAEGVPGRAVHQILQDARPLDADTRDALSRVMAAHVVLLNRAPTLHRQSLLAFQPVLVADLTLRLHPMACEGLNADFDGDTMAVHLPLSAAAQDEARRLLTLRANLRSPATGQLAVAPSKDMLLGLYRLTQRRCERHTAPLPLFRDADEAALAVELGHLDWVEPCRVRLGGQVHETTPGRAKVWQAVNEATGDHGIYDLDQLDKGATRAMLTRCLEQHGPALTVSLLDALKTLGFRHATSDGVTVGIEDVLPSPDRDEVIRNAQKQAASLTALRDAGHATPDETDRALIAHWTAVKDDLGARTVAHLRAHPENPLGVMLASGARGNASQVTQLAGMRGLMARADGSTFPTPILASFRQGLTATEFFISSHGARKGSADTALRTAQAGYLTRRLVNLLQAVQVTEEDCDTPWGVTEDAEMPGRTVLAVLPDGRRVVRSPLTCASKTGVCRACMGLALHDLTPHPLGANVGILAAQSLGEPGTQLTMRTFHTGGVAGNDMTAGLGTLVKLLERPGPHPARMAQDLLAVYASQGVTLHPVHAELTARTLAGRGLTPGRSGGGWLAQAAAGRTTPVLTRAALHAERDPLTDPLARVMTPGLHVRAAARPTELLQSCWSHPAPGPTGLPVPSATFPRSLSPALESR